MATLSINLPDTLAEMINEKVKSGVYHSASEVIGESLIIIKAQDVVHELRVGLLRDELAVAQKQAEQGEGTVYTRRGELSEKIIAEGNRILAHGGKLLK